MNRRLFFVSASRVSLGIAIAGAGALVASESKPHGEKAAAKGHGEKPADKGHGEKPADKGHGEKAADKGHGEKPAAAKAPEKTHVPEATKPAQAAHKPAAAKPASRPVAKAKAARAPEKAPELRPRTAEEVYAELKAGNRRFIAGNMRHPNTSNLRVRQTGREGDRPYAVLLTCADSRVAPELIFDQGIGDLFTVRVAGNVANTDEIASVEYAVDQLHAPLVIVMGHTECDAVKAVVDGKPFSGALDKMMGHIKTALLRTRAGAPTLRGKPLVNAVVQMNVWESIEETLKASPALRDQVRVGELKIIGAQYLAETGEVNWMGPHPDQCDFV